MSKIQRTRMPSSAPGRGSAPGRAGDEALARLLASAAPPLARGWAERELHGEADAAAAFRLGPSAAARRRPARTGRLFALKTVIAVVALSGGGVALAAANLPSHAHRPAPAPVRSLVAPATTARPVPAVRSSRPSPAPRHHVRSAQPNQRPLLSSAPSPVSAGASAGVSARNGPVSGSAGVNVHAPVPTPSLPSLP